MSATAMALLMLALLLFGNIPVAFAFGIASTLYILTNDLPIALTIQRTFYGIHDFTLLAIPLFVLAGNVMNISGVTIRILRFANALVGHTRGGLANANVVASIIFSGMSGSALADAGGLGTVEIEAMRREVIPRDSPVGVTGASATIGPIIPPSIPLVIYGAIAEVSVGALFLAGLLPGLLMGLCLMVYVSWQARKLLVEKQPTPTLRILVKATWEAAAGRVHARHNSGRHWHRHIHAHRGRSRDRALWSGVGRDLPGAVGQEARLRSFGDLQDDLVDPVHSGFGRDFRLGAGALERLPGTWAGS